MRLLLVSAILAGLVLATPPIKGAQAPASRAKRSPRRTASRGHMLTCFRFFGQEILLFWTAGGELSDVEEQFREAW